MLYKIQTHPSAARGVAVEDFELVVPNSEAPAYEGKDADKFLPPYFAKHLTCPACSASLIHIRGTWFCKNCLWQEGCDE